MDAETMRERIEAAIRDEYYKPGTAADRILALLRPAPESETAERLREAATMAVAALGAIDGRRRARCARTGCRLPHYVVVATHPDAPATDFADGGADAG